MDEYTVDTTVAEDEVMAALYSLNINNIPPGTLSNLVQVPLLRYQQMANRCLFLKKYDKKYHFE
jgi:hypothetical protein